MLVYGGKPSICIDILYHEFIIAIAGWTLKKHVSHEYLLLEKVDESSGLPPLKLDEQIPKNDAIN